MTVYETATTNNNNDNNVNDNNNNTVAPEGGDEGADRGVCASSAYRYEKWRRARNVQSTGRGRISVRLPRGRCVTSPQSATSAPNIASALRRGRPPAPKANTLPQWLAPSASI
jgi:hypothetical protein